MKIKLNDYEKKVVYLDFLEKNYHKKKKLLFDNDKLNFINLKEANNYVNKLTCSIILYKSKDYPNQLCELVNPPLVLYYQGDLSLLSLPKLAIVGSRYCTNYGKNYLELLFKKIKGYAVVSGLAYGIDQHAHLFSLNNNIKTIAVIGSGLNNIYPSNKELIKKIKTKGLIITEHPPHIKAKPWFFPMRNRIIGALSSKVLVIEAGVKSGSLITAEIALDLNKEIYALPGSVFSKTSCGTNLLIEEGANILTVDSNFENNCKNDFGNNFNN